MFARILKQSFARQRRRKTLALLAVTAGMTAATALLTLRLNLGDDLNHELGSYGANLLVTPAADSLPVSLNGVDLRPAHSGALLAEADLGRIKTIFWANNVSAFAPVLFTQVRVNGANEPVTLLGAYLDHAVAVPGEDRTFTTGLRRLEPAWQVAGTWPDDATDQVLLGETLARRLGLRVGQQLELNGEAETHAATVTGLVSTGGAEDNEIVAPLAMAQALANEPGRLRQIWVAAVTKPEDAFSRRNPAAMSPADAERWMCSPYAVTIAAQLQQALPGASAHVIRPVAETEGTVLSELRLIMIWITTLALVASALAIAAAMTAAVLERRDEIALMKAVGAQDPAIGCLFFAEAALLGLAGGGAGYICGGFLAQAIAFGVLDHAAQWKWVLLPLVLLLGVAVALAGSLQPLRGAMRMDPAIVLRGQP